MRILIIGGGSVGLGIASCLLKSGNKVTIVARKDTCAKLQSQGLLRTGVFGEHHSPPETFDVYSEITDVPTDTYDYVLVSTKSFDTKLVAQEVKATRGLISVDTKIVLFQNGYGNFEIFSSFFPEKQIFVARVITGFRLIEKNHVDITVHAAPILVGSFLPSHSDEVADLCGMITQGDIPAEVSQQIDKDLWAKILYNSMLNPLGAIFGVPYGALGESEYGRTMIEGIATEVFAVMEANGYSTHWPTVEAFLEEFYTSMLPPTKEHESSMLQSIRANRRTEIDALNGAIVELGRKNKVQTPLNKMVTNSIKFLESINTDSTKN